MNYTHSSCFCTRTLLSLGLLFLFLLPTARGSTSYTITDLGMGTSSVAYGINNLGQVAGFFYPVSPFEHVPPQVFVYSHGKFLDVNIEGYALAINDLGQLVGVLNDGGLSMDYAFLYRNGRLLHLDTLDGFRVPRASAINNSGQVVGDGYLVNGSDDGGAFLYSNGRIHDLGTLGGGGAEATGINNRGQIVGTSAIVSNTGNNERAFLYTNGRMIDLTPFVGSSASAINDRGQIVGSINSTGNLLPQHAALFSGGQILDLGVLFPGGTSAASAINNRGQIVGYSYSVTNTYHAFIYSEGRLQDLNNLLPLNSGWVLTSANGINDRGQIVGVGISPTSGQFAVFLLTPVPFIP